MQKFKIIFALTLALVLVAGSVSAAEFIAPDQKGSENVSLASDEEHKDLYVAGAAVTVNGLSRGDLYAGGGMVTINGDVEADLNLGGGNVIVNGNVGDDARIAGGNVSINSQIAGDLLVAGGNLSITEKTRVGADLTAAGGNIVLDAPVVGKARIGGGTITINSKIEGDLIVHADEELVFESKSVVTGKILYTGKKPALVKEGAQVSTIEFTKIKSGASNAKSFVGISALVNLLALMIVGLILVYAAQGRTRLAIRAIFAQPWLSLGTGLIGLIVTPFVVVILFVTVIGYYLALMLLFSYILILLAGSVVGATFLGSWIVKLAMQKQDLEADWLAVVAGVIGYVILSFIPFIGWLAIMILSGLGLGSLLRLIRYELKRDYN